MIFLTLPVLFAIAIAGLYWYMRKQPDQRSRLRRALVIGLGIGLTRATLASFGWYVVEHTGGPLQVPAFALAMMAWPEAALISGRRVTQVPPEFYVSLSVLLMTSTLVIVGLVAVVAGRTGTASRRSATDPHHTR